MVILSLISFGDAAGFDTWQDEAAHDLTSQPSQPAVAFNAIVMSMLDVTPAIAGQAERDGARTIAA